MPVPDDAAIALYVMVNARPEQGATLPHSFTPLASIVVTSTTPGPFAVLTVHEPVVATPLKQIEVNDGLAISEPILAETGWKME